MGIGMKNGTYPVNCPHCDKPLTDAFGSFNNSVDIREFNIQNFF